eukprot:4765045-Prymnesium_polylepis.2
MNGLYRVESCLTPWFGYGFYFGFECDRRSRSHIMVRLCGFGFGFDALRPEHASEHAQTRMQPDFAQTDR